MYHSAVASDFMTANILRNFLSSILISTILLPEIDLSKYILATELQWIYINFIAKELHYMSILQ